MDRQADAATIGGSARLFGDNIVGMSDAYMHQVEKLQEVLFNGDIMVCE